MTAMRLVQKAHAAGRTFTDTISREDQKAAGQFMTPPAIAEFMARRLVAGHDHRIARILEPGAGAGVLVAAVVDALLAKPEPPEQIEALLFEQDPKLVSILKAICDRMREACEALGVRFEHVVRNEDFLLSEIALSGQPIDGLLTIANPPFFKLNKATDKRAKLHAYAVYGQPNVYGLFMAAAARLTPPDGRWCFITPRSWMSGQYFQAVRHTLLRHLVVDSLHAFESRRDSFDEDAVLQETVIAWATGRSAAAASEKILLTRSHGSEDLETAAVQAFPFERVVSGDEHATLSLPTDQADPFEGWSATLKTYGLQVSTGPVVAFRAVKHIREQADRQTVPLLWLQHVGQQAIRWPIQKKREHIQSCASNAWMLLPNQPMVVMRRFSPKEDARRVTCAAYEGDLPGDVIGLENHLNYIHRPGGPVTTYEARGLAAFLASRFVDAHFRALSGSTQVNAMELRKLPLPPLGALVQIGRSLPAEPSLHEIDAVVERTLGLPPTAEAVARAA